MKNLAFIPLMIFILASCTAKKTVVEANPKIKVIEPTSTNKYFYDAIEKKSDFEAVKITSKIDVEIGKFIPTINATIYIENNQKIWMNMSAFFMNMARGIATPQGLKAYEKIDNTYIDSDFSYLNKLLKINFLNYNSLQNLLVGKTFMPIKEEDFTLHKNNDGYSLKSIKTQEINANGKTNEYHTEYEFSNDFDLIKVSLKDVKSKDNLEILYQNWNNINGQRFPKNVKLIIKGQKTDQILIENTKFEFSKMETPYSVPNNYKKREL